MWDPSGHDGEALTTLAVLGIGEALEVFGTNPELEQEVENGVVSTAQEAEAAVEGLAEDIGSDVPETVTQLQEQQAQIVENQQADLKDAIDEFGAEGKGLHFQELGKAVQDVADKAIEEGAPEDAIIKNNYNFPGITGPGSQIDSLITRGDTSVFVETKYSLATDGDALTRAVNQLSNASDFSGPSDSVILNVARPPTPDELTEFLSNLDPEVVHRVQVVSNVTDLYQAVKDAFQP
jgi:hypothetical protein